MLLRLKKKTFKAGRITEGNSLKKILKKQTKKKQKNGKYMCQILLNKQMFHYPC